MPDSDRPQLVLNESSLNFLLQLTAKKRERLIQCLKELANSTHEEPIGIETDSTGRELYIRIFFEWEVTYWSDWENELRVVRIQKI